jgi:hypothetical protein
MVHVIACILSHRCVDAQPDIHLKHAALIDDRSHVSTFSLNHYINHLGLKRRYKKALLTDVFSI